MTHIDVIPLSSSGSHCKKSHLDSAPSVSASSNRKPRVNWHEAAACAIEIELRDYAQFLQFLSEYTLGKNSHHIDLLVITPFRFFRYVETTLLPMGCLAA